MRIDVIVEARLSPARLAALGELAERQGLGGIWVSSMSDARDPFVSFVPLVQATSRIRMGPIAISPFDLHPLKMANALLTLNEMAGGRAQMVVGAGGGIAANIGVKPVRVVRALRECMEIMRQAATGRPLRYEGEIFRINWYHPSWVESTAPQLYAGANGPQMLRAAPRFADAVMVSDFLPAQVQRAREIIDRSLRDAGAEPAGFPMSNFWAWHVKASREEAEREARRWLTVRGTLYPPYVNDVLDEDEAAIVNSNIQSFFAAYNRKSAVIEGVPPEIVQKLVGRCTSASALADLDREIERLREFRRAGLTQIALRIYEDPEASIRLLGERVLPALG